MKPKPNKKFLVLPVVGSPEDLNPRRQAYPVNEISYVSPWVRDANTCAIYFNGGGCIHVRSTLDELVKRLNGETEEPPTASAKHTKAATV
jgi:hypothetical protein